MTTTEALKNLLTDKAKRAAAGISAKRAATLMHRIKNNLISSEKMTKILLDAGFKVKRETEWIDPAQWQEIIATIPEP